MAMGEIQKKLLLEFEALKQDLINNNELNDICEKSENLIKAASKLKYYNSKEIHLIIAEIVYDNLCNNVHYQNIKKILADSVSNIYILDKYNLYNYKSEFINKFSTLNFLIISIESVICAIEENNFVEIESKKIDYNIPKSEPSSVHISSWEEYDYTIAKIEQEYLTDTRADDYFMNDQDYEEGYYEYIDECYEEYMNYINSDDKEKNRLK